MCNDDDCDDVFLRYEDIEEKVRAVVEEKLRQIAEGAVLKWISKNENRAKEIIEATFSDTVNEALEKKFVEMAKIVAQEKFIHFYDWWKKYESESIKK